MSRTNVVLDNDLVEKCQQATGIKTKKSLIDFALHEVLRHENQKKILKLKGSIEWQGDISAWRRGRLA